VLAFGALVAAGVPLLLALSGVAATIGLLGLAAAVLIDATIIRGVLPATMKLLGEWNFDGAAEPEPEPVRA